MHFPSGPDVSDLATEWAATYGYQAQRMSNGVLFFSKRPEVTSLSLIVELASREGAHTLSCWCRQRRILSTRDISLTDPARAARLQRESARQDVNALLWRLGAPPLTGSTRM